MLKGKKKKVEDIMVSYDKYDIVFQEIPNEVSLAFTIEGCPNRCKGCHSPHLRLQKGDKLDEVELKTILNKYKNDITCVLFLGGDAFHNEIYSFCKIIKDKYRLKTAFYSGFDMVNVKLFSVLDYYKFGSYKEELGGLNSPTTNQIMLKNITKELQK